MYAVPVRSIALLSAAAFASAATARVADPLIPQIAEEFHAGVADASIVATGFTLAYGLFQFLYGAVGDRFGKYAIVGLMTLLSAVGTGLAAFAETLDMLGALRLLSGAAAGAIIPLSMAHIGDVVPFENRQPVLARFLSGQILGVIAGQALGGAFGEYLGWRGIFHALAASYLIIALLLWRELRSGRVIQTRAKISLAGIGRTYLQIARARRVWLIVGCVFVEGFLFFGGFTYIGAYLRKGFGLDYLTIGACLASFGIGALSYTMAAPRLVRRLGVRGLVTGGGAALCVAFAMLATAPDWRVLPPAIILSGFGFYMLHNTLQNQATQMAPAARGMAVSVFASFFFIAQAAGVALGGAAIEAFGYRVGFAVVALFLPLLAAFLRVRL